VAHAPDYGIYTVFLDGKPFPSGAELELEPGANLGGPPGIDAYHNEVYVAEDHVLGWTELTAGRHTLAFVCAGKNTQSAGHNLGIDTLVLSRIAQVQPAGGERAQRLRRLGEGRPGVPEAEIKPGFRDPDPWVRQAAVWAATQRPDLASQSTAELSAALQDSDAPVRALAALALRNAGKPALAALPQLRDALRDSDASVRSMVADTIASFGPDAAPAVPDLVAACQAPNETVQVQRSMASALGAIGLAARPALPALRRLKAIPRVRWAAEAAIARIEGAR
jgi:hypothetical protein